MKTAGMNEEKAMDATDLTQLSSREQLSALMDGALPADETRFLLRRLQHDASLAECWERWRLSAEVMRGLAPAQRLPADFASRVAASLRDDERQAARTNGAVASNKASVRPPAWLRWGGGAAMAASLAIVAFMIQPTATDSPASLDKTVAVTDAAPSAANDTLARAGAPSRKTPSPPAPARDPAAAGFESQTAALASAVAVLARPARNTRRGAQSGSTLTPAMLPAANDVQSSASGIAAVVTDIHPLLPQVGIITRPWPRSVLPQYGNAGLSVGFGDSTRNSVPNNPFQVRIGNLSPKLIEHANGQAEEQPASDSSHDAQDAVVDNQMPSTP